MNMAILLFHSAGTWTLSMTTSNDAQMPATLFQTAECEMLNECMAAHTHAASWCLVKELIHTCTTHVAWRNSMHQQYVCMHANVCVCVCVCVYATKGFSCAFVCTSVCVRARVVCVCVCVCVLFYVCTSVFVGQLNAPARKVCVRACVCVCVAQLIRHVYACISRNECVHVYRVNAFVTEVCVCIDLCSYAPVTAQFVSSWSWCMCVRVYFCMFWAAH